MRFCDYTQPICKIEITKFIFFAFFLITIRSISQKCIIFAPSNKKARQN